jgi:hypothetical protein
MEINDILNNKEALKQLISALQNLVGDDKDDASVTTNAKENDKSNINTKSRRKIFSSDRNPTSNQHQVNRFDDMAEKNMHKGDVEIDKLLRQHPKTPRIRKQNKVNVVCRVCGVKETIPSSLLVDTKDRYKCNSCSSKAG